MLPIFHYLTQHRYNILLADVLTSLSLNLIRITLGHLFRKKEKTQL